MRKQNPLSILLAEDDDTARDILVSVLAVKFPGIALHTADNGRTAFDCFRKYSPPIIITDVNMPVMDGIRMAREIKSIDAGVKFIVLTAFSDKTILDGAAMTGIEFDHYIMKPTDYNRLFVAVEDCIARIAPDYALTAFQRNDEVHPRT